MTYDLAVVGGGWVGACAAWLAARRRPDWRVVLLERAQVGGGATRHSVGLDLPFGSTPHRRALAAESAARFREMACAVPGLARRPVPLFGLASTAAVDAVRQGYPADSLRPASDAEAAELAARFGGLRVGDDARLFAGPQAAYAFPADATAALAADFRARGGEVREGCAVVAAEKDGDARRLELADGRALRARRVLVSTGPWLPRGIGAEAAAEAGVRIKKVVALHVDVPARPGDPVLFFHDEDAFLLPVPERGEWLFSFTCREWDVEPGVALTVTPADRALALSVLERWGVRWAERCTGARVFCDAYGPEWNPLARSVDPDLAVAGACAGSGYRLGPAVALRALRALEGFDASAADARPRGHPVTVTAAQPTPNGDLHLGHLSGPFLGADVHTRYLRLRGRDVRYVCGSDDHQSYVVFKGEQTGDTADGVCARYAEAIEATLRAARVEPDRFVRHARSPSHARFVTDFVATMHARGSLVERDAPALWCDDCDRYLFEAYVSGGCPHCGTPTGGNACEVCGRPNSVVDLLDPHCRCGRPPSERPVRRLFLPWSRWAPELRAHLAGAVMNPRLRALAEGMLQAGLPDVAVSHPGDWGLPVPVPGYEHQRIYTWLEMLAGYMYAAAEAHGRPAWEPDAEVVQFFGFDNGWYHTLLYPAFCMAHGGVAPAARYVTNEFYCLDGLKFSTSRMHAIWGRELLDVAPADLVRFYLAWSGPEAEQTSFTVADFEATVHRELVEGWQGWLRRLGEKAARESGGRAPAWDGPRTPEQRRFLAELAGVRDGMAAAYAAEGFSPRRAARLLSELVERARTFGAAQDAWAGVAARAEERRAGLALELSAARALAVLAWPLLPDFGARLHAVLADESPVHTGWSGALDGVEPGRDLAGLGVEHFPDVRRRFVRGVPASAPSVEAEAVPA